MARAKKPCVFCGNPSYARHHYPVLKSEGGKRTIPVCRKCHTWIHSVSGHWAKFGKNGGLKTASNPINYRRNLKQYRNCLSRPYATPVDRYVDQSAFIR